MCALKGNLLKYIKKNLYISSVHKENAKLYAIIIFILIKENLEKFKYIVICNDENFYYVKKYLISLIENKELIPEIINITEFRNIFNRKMKSPADNYANSYRKRALNKNKWYKGPPLNVVKITFRDIQNFWKKVNVSD